MKKILVILLAGMMVLSLVGCAPEETMGSVEEDITDVSASQEVVTEQDSAAQEPWGVEDKITAANANGTSAFFISFPGLLGTIQGGGVVGRQPDGTLVIADGQDKKTPDNVASVSEVFPAYFALAESVLDGYYRMYGGNYVFKITDQSEVKINDCDMAKFSGTLSYEYERQPVSSNWVAYATQLSENGAYAYWMVIDAADGTVATDVDIAETAQKMAESYRERKEW